MSRTANDNRAETTMMSAALQEALTRLKAQERATAARAEASERLSNQIITGVGAGLIVVEPASGSCRSSIPPRAES